MGIFDRKPNIKKMKKRKDVEGLIKALGHKDHTVQSNAAYALEWIVDKRAVEPLTQALKDKDESVQKAAKKALEMIKTKET